MAVLPADAEVLVPGLADMHTHVMESADLALYAASGVTTVLHMGEAPSGLVATANPAIERGELIGPHLLFAFMLDGSPASEHFFVTSSEEARHAVALAKVNGYRFIKVYNDVSAEEFAAIVAEARARGLCVVGHGVRAVGLPQGLVAGQAMVAHAEEFYYTAFAHTTDPARIPEVVSATRRAGSRRSSWSTPTGGSATLASTDGPILRRFTNPGAFRYWRLTVDHPSGTLSGAGVFFYLGAGASAVTSSSPTASRPRTSTRPMRQRSPASRSATRWAS